MITFSLGMSNPRLVAFTWPSSSWPADAVCTAHWHPESFSWSYLSGFQKRQFWQHLLPVSLQVLPVRLTRVTPPLEPNCETNFLLFLLFLAKLCFKISTSRKMSHQISYMIPTWASMDFTVSCSRLGFFMLLTFACRCRINHTHGSQI